MKMHCCLCGRSMSNAKFFIAGLPVGDACAKRAGLHKLVSKKGGSITMTAVKLPKKREEETIDMFEGLE